MNITPHASTPVVSVDGLRVTAQADDGREIALVSDIHFTVQKGKCWP